MARLQLKKIVGFLALPAIVCSAAATTAHADEHVRRHMPVLTSPTIHEGADIANEIRITGSYTKVPQDFASQLPETGGHVNTAIAQVRFAINDRWGIFIDKLGYAATHFDDSLPSDNGLLNVGFGAKYAIIAEPKLGRYLTVGGRYEAPLGGIDSAALELQGGGDGMFDMFVSFSTFMGAKTAFQSSLGLDFALDSDHDSSFLHYTFHVDHEVLPNIFAVFEGNLLSTIIEGERTDGTLFGAFEGYDLFNFGNTSSGTVATLGAGARYKLNDAVMLGAGLEIPVTNRQDIMDVRVVGDGTLQF